MTVNLNESIMGRIKQHINLNTVLISFATAIFVGIADVGIKKVDNNATELAAVHATQQAVLRQLELINKELDDKVTKGEFKSEIRRIDTELDNITKARP